MLPLASSPLPRTVFTVLIGIACGAALSACAGGAATAGRAAFTAGDYQTAAQNFEQQTHGEHPARAWANLGASQLAGGDARSALSALEKAADLMPEHPAVRVNLGDAYRQVGRLDDAQKQYLTAAGLDPGNAEIFYRLGILYEIYLNQPTLALAAYRDYLEKGGTHTQTVQEWIATLERKQAE